MNRYQSNIIRTPQPRPGTIRYGIIGAAIGISIIWTVPLICRWAVWGGTWLEKIFN